MRWRRGTAAEWTTADPILLEGEPGFETDTGKLKVGDGSTAWTSLDYYQSAAVPDPSGEPDDRWLTTLGGALVYTGAPTGVTYGTPAVALGTAAAAGSIDEAIRRDSTIVAFDATVPATQAFGDSAATGSAAVAARRDHKHAMPANPVSLATPAIVLGSSAAAGAASTLIRSDATIAAFDATNPTTQAFGDAAAVGTAAFAARRDHKHAMMADPFTGAAAGGDLNGTYPNPLVDVGLFGGVAWTVVAKTIDEGITNNTLQNDNELLFVPASGGMYEVELLCIYSNAAGATPDIKIAFGEDTTKRGGFVTTSLSAADAAQTIALDGRNNAVVTAGTDTALRAVFFKGWYLGTGATVNTVWAQNVTDATATVMKAGSVLRYRRIV